MKRRLFSNALALTMLSCFGFGAAGAPKKIDPGHCIAIPVEAEGDGSWKVSKSGETGAANFVCFHAGEEPFVGASAEELSEIETQLRAIETAAKAINPANAQPSFTEALSIADKVANLRTSNLAFAVRVNPEPMYRAQQAIKTAKDALVAAGAPVHPAATGADLSTGLALGADVASLFASGEVRSVAGLRFDQVCTVVGDAASVEHFRLLYPACALKGNEKDPRPLVTLPADTNAHAIGHAAYNPWWADAVRATAASFVHADAGAATGSGGGAAGFAPAGLTARLATSPLGGWALGAAPFIAAGDAFRLCSLRATALVLAVASRCLSEHCYFGADVDKAFSSAFLSAYDTLPTFTPGKNSHPCRLIVEDGKIKLPAKRTVAAAVVSLVPVGATKAGVVCGKVKIPVGGKFFTHAVDVGFEKPTIEDAADIDGKKIPSGTKFRPGSLKDQKGVSFAVLPNPSDAASLFEVQLREKAVPPNSLTVSSEHVTLTMDGKDVSGLGVCCDWLGACKEFRVSGFGDALPDKGPVYATFFESQEEYESAVAELAKVNKGSAQKKSRVLACEDDDEKAVTTLRATRDGDSVRVSASRGLPEGAHFVVFSDRPIEPPTKSSDEKEETEKGAQKNPKKNASDKKVLDFDDEETQLEGDEINPVSLPEESLPESPAAASEVVPSTDASVAGAGDAANTAGMGGGSLPTTGAVSGIFGAVCLSCLGLFVAGFRKRNK